MTSHVKTAYDFGVKQALAQYGYASVEDLEKDAASPGMPQAADARVAPVSEAAGRLGSMIAAATQEKGLLPRDVLMRLALQDGRLGGVAGKFRR
jgi:hypothetical protein